MGALTGRTFLQGCGATSRPWPSIRRTHVYWTAWYDAGVFRCPKSGCSGAPEVVALNQAQPEALALDETHVFFVDSRPSGAVLRAAKDGSGWGPIAEQQNEPVSVAIDSEYVY